MKDLGHFRYFIGLKISHSSPGIILSQQKYIYDILNRVDFSYEKTMNTPLKNNMNLRLTDDERLTDVAR